MNPLNNNSQLNQVETQLHAIAEAADEGKELPSTQPDGNRAPSHPDPIEEFNPKLKNPEEQPKADLPDEPTATETDKSVTDTEKQRNSKYIKARKEAERRDRSWKTLEAEKTAFREQQASLQRERQALTKAQQEAAKPKVDGKWSPEELEAAAKEFAAEGKPEIAEKARTEAKRLRDQAAIQAKQEQDQKFQMEWSENLAAMKKEHPEMENSESPLGQEIRNLLHYPQFSMYSGGIKDAVMIAKWKLAAASVPDLQKKIADQIKEIDRLTQKTSLHGSLPASPPVSRKFHELSATEMEEEIRRNLAALEN